MMKLAIWGYNQIGLKIEEIIKRKNIDNCQASFYMDNCQNLTDAHCFEVCSLEEGTERYMRGDVDRIILAVKNCDLDKEVRRAKTLKIKEVYYLPGYYLEDYIDDISLGKMIRIDTDMVRLRYLEYHVSNHCNLNCRGCGHFSNICNNSFGDLEQFDKDLHRLKELFWGITEIRLMGGEPTLNPLLSNFIECARDIFPDTRLTVVTNGLTIRNLTDDLLRTMHDYSCMFDITVYPPTEKQVDIIKRICELYKIKYRLSERVDDFIARLDPSGNQESKVSYERCQSKYCTFLGNGTISTCGKPIWMEVYNNRFGNGSDVIKVDEEDIINLYEKNLNGKDLLKRLYRPITMCKYCTLPRFFPWEGNYKDPQKDDWCV